jgi:uncharacterized membrane protein
MATNPTLSRWRIAGLAFVFIWFFAGGIAHFVIGDFFANIMPPYIPSQWHYPAVYVSGVFELLGALGLLLTATRRLAGIGLFALVICVSPANIHMWMHPELFPQVPPILLSIRLVIQVFLLWVIWRSAITAAPAQRVVLAR